MHEAAKLRPVVIDESLTGLDRLILARELGYSGVRSKLARDTASATHGRCCAEIQDVSLRSRSDLSRRIPRAFRRLAARVPGVTAVEANARQYMPKANKPWSRSFQESSSSRME